MDEQLERLRRAVARDPGDRAQAVRYAGALERAGRFEEAWELLDGIDAREELAALARRNPVPVLERLGALDYRRARLMLERLGAIGEARHPAIVCLASARDGDRVIKAHAQRLIAASCELGDAPILSGRLTALLDDGGLKPGAVRNHPGYQAHVERTRDEARGFARRVLDQSEGRNAVAMLPWLLPLLTCGDPALAASALGAVRRLLHRDGPPLDADLIASLLREQQGEPA